MDNSEHEGFVSKYEHRPFYDIFPITCVIILISVLGIFGNSQIVWATCRKRSLRSNCNILIAFAAFSDIFHQFAHFILGYHLFSGQTFIPLNRCFWVQLVPVFWMNFGTFIVLSIGFDRLLSVVVPLEYKQWEPSYYTTFMLLFPTAFGFWMTFIAYTGVLQNQEAKVICVIAEAYHVPAKDDWLHIAVIVNFTIILTYPAVWIVIKVKNGKIDKRILRSLTMIVFLVLFGWFSAALGVSICLALKWNEERIFKAQMYIGTLINLSISLNYPVYMFFCKQYKIAFMEQLQILGCIKKRIGIGKNGVLTVTAASQMPQQQTRSTNSRISEISVG